jgi:hypothetical protein
MFLSHTFCSDSVCCDFNRNFFSDVSSPNFQELDESYEKIKSGVLNKNTGSQREGQNRD